MARISPPIELDININIGTVSVKTLFKLENEAKKETWYFIYGST